MTKEEVKKLLDQEIRCAIKCKEGCTRECEKCRLYNETEQRNIEDMFYKLFRDLNDLYIFTLRRWQCTMTQRDIKCGNTKHCQSCMYSEESCDDLIANLNKLKIVTDALID